MITEFVKPQNKQPHPRILIRNRVKELMKENTDLGGRWFCSRPKPVFYTETPCGLIYFTNEPAEHRDTAPRNYKRDLELTTEVAMVANTERENELDDWLDSRAFEIERTLGGDRFLGLPGLVSDVVLERTEPVDIVADGDVNVGALRVFWKIVYQTNLYYTGKLDKFLRYSADWEIDKEREGPEAVDDVTIREE